MKVPEYNSCDEEGYFFIYSFNPDYVNPGDSALIWVEGGVSPFTWTVSGSDFTFAEATTDVQYNVISLDPTIDVDVEADITVTDACGTVVTGHILSCNCHETPCCEDPNYSFSIAPGYSTIVRLRAMLRLGLVGGCPPFRWRVAPTSKNNWLEYHSTNERVNWIEFETSDFDGVIISVTDACGNSVEFKRIIAIEGGVDGEGGSGDAEDYAPCGGEDYIPVQFDDENNPTWVVPGEDFWFSTLPETGEKPHSWYYDSLADGGLGEDSELFEVTYDDSLLIRLHDEEEVWDLITLTVEDICGGDDEAQVEIITCCSEAHTSPTYNETLSDDTIAPGGTADVVVKDGCPPYTWEVSGLGYYLDADETVSTGNVVNCPGGACNVDYGEVATVTVVDACGEEVGVWNIRNTSGSWQNETYLCNKGGATDKSCEVTPDGGIYKYKLKLRTALYIDPGYDGGPCLGGETIEQCIPDNLYCMDLVQSLNIYCFEDFVCCRHWPANSGQCFAAYDGTLAGNPSCNWHTQGNLRDVHIDYVIRYEWKC